MLELLIYLQTKGFEIYIATEWDEDFVRDFSDEVHRIPLKSDRFSLQDADR